MRSYGWAWQARWGSGGFGGFRGVSGLKGFRGLGLLGVQGLFRGSGFSFLWFRGFEGLGSHGRNSTDSLHSGSLHWLYQFYSYKLQGSYYEVTPKMNYTRDYR